MLQTGVWLFPIGRVCDVVKVTILSQPRHKLGGFAASKTTGLLIGYLAIPRTNSATSLDLGEHFDANLPLPILGSTVYMDTPIIRLEITSFKERLNYEVSRSLRHGLGSLSTIPLLECISTPSRISSPWPLAYFYRCIFQREIVWNFR
jgi:hypothetical protein